MKDKDGKFAAKKAEEARIMELMKQVIRKIGYVPGKKGFKTFLRRDHNENVSVKRCKKLMNKMNLSPNRPLKDAYKHQATHDHVCASVGNKLNQNFYLGARRAILTDITYLYYGPQRTPIYLCAFKDAYTKEILGHASSKHMTVDLVKQAYDKMMEKHRNEFRTDKYEVFIHSDQGSQYLSTTFKKMLSDDQFVQSVSGRGNSQDNSPMESFFNRTKTNILNLVALCPDAETAFRLIDGYIKSYNTEQYQYNLAGLTPNEFYQYVTTGIYPLDNYYGVKADELRTITDLVNDRRKAADEKNARIREARARRNEERNKLKSTPLQIVARDQRILRAEINKWMESHKISEGQIRKLKEILEKAKTAAKFIESVSKEILEELMTPENWQKYEQLNYIFDMDGMF